MIARKNMSISTVSLSASLILFLFSARPPTALSITGLLHLVGARLQHVPNISISDRLSTPYLSVLLLTDVTAVSNLC